MGKGKGPVKVIREWCIRCASSKKAVRNCSKGPESCDPCPLWVYRQGRDPARRGVGPRLSSEGARSLRKSTTQVVRFEGNKSRSGEGAGESGSPVLEDPRASAHIRPLTPAEIMSQMLLHGLHREHGLPPPGGGVD